jgi:hypothetical protein
LEIDNEILQISGELLLLRVSPPELSIIVAVAPVIGNDATSPFSVPGAMGVIDKLRLVSSSTVDASRSSVVWPPTNEVASAVKEASASTITRTAQLENDDLT